MTLHDLTLACWTVLIIKHKFDAKKKKKKKKKKKITVYIIL